MNTIIDYNYFDRKEIFSLTNIDFSLGPASVSIFVDSLCKLLADITWRNISKKDIIKPFVWWMSHNK